MPLRPPNRQRVVVLTVSLDTDMRKSSVKRTIKRALSDEEFLPVLLAQNLLVAHTKSWAVTDVKVETFVDHEGAEDAWDRDRYRARKKMIPALKDIATGWDHESNCPCYTTPDQRQEFGPNGEELYGTVPCRVCRAMYALEI